MERPEKEKRGTRSKKSGSIGKEGGCDIDLAGSI